MKTQFSHNKQRVQAVTRALSLLQAVATRNEGSVLTGLSREVGLNKSTAYQLLATLESEGFVEKDKESQRYRIGTKVLDIAATFLNGSDIIANARPLLRIVRDQTGETATLRLLVGEHRVTVAKEESVHPIRRSVPWGEVAPLIRGAGGKAILAFMKGDRVKSIVAHSRKNGTLRRTEAVSLMKELRSIRLKGFSITKAEHVPGAFGISLPLFDSGSEIIGSLGISGPLGRWSRPLANKGVRILREAINRLSQSDLQTKPKAGFE